MPQIPTTYASPRGVSAAGSAPQMGQTLSIHSMDAPYEESIRGLKQVADMGNQVGRGIQRFGAEINDYIAEQKAVKDKSDYMEANDDLNEWYQKEYLPSQENIVDPQTGQVEPGMYGRNFESELSGRMQMIAEQRGLSEASQGMFYKSANHFGSQQSINIAKTRVGMIQAKTASELTTRVDKSAMGVTDHDIANGEVAIRLRAKIDPKWALTMDRDIAQLKTTVRYNAQVKVMKDDPYNYKVPEYLDNETKYKLGQVKKQAIYEAKQADTQRVNEARSNFDQRYFDKENAVSEIDVDNLAKVKNSDGTLAFSRSFIKTAYEDVKNQRIGKETEYDKVAFNQLETIIYDFDPKAKNAQETQKKINERIREFPVKQRKLLDGYVKDKNKIIEKTDKLSDNQKLDRKTLMDSLKKSWAMDEIEDDDRFAIFDKAEDMSLTKKVVAGMTAPILPLVSLGILGAEFAKGKELSKRKAYQAMSDIRKKFDIWATSAPNWDMKQAQEKMDELTKPYAIEAYQEEVLTGVKPQVQTMAQPQAKVNPKDPMGLGL